MSEIELLQEILVELRKLNARADAADAENKQKSEAAEKQLQGIMSLLPPELLKGLGGK